MRTSSYTSLFRPLPRPLSLRAARLVNRVSPKQRCPSSSVSVPHTGSASAKSATRHGPYPINNAVELVQPPNLRPPIEKRYDAPAWMSIIEPFLPDGLRNPSVRSSPPADIVNILLDAREWGSVDLVSHLWFSRSSPLDSTLPTKQYRQDTAEWLLNILLDAAAAAPHTGASIVDLIVPTIQTSSQSLDEMTSGRMRDDHHLQALQSMTPQSAGSKPTLQYTTERKTPVQESRSHRVLGEVWLRLGMILRKAIDVKDERARSEAVLLATRIMTRIHDTPQVAKYLRMHEKGCGTDAALDNHQDSRPVPDLATFASSGRMPAISTLQNSSAIGLTALFEYVLWACVYGGWIHEASLLLVPRRDLRRGSRQRSQNLPIQPSQTVTKDVRYNLHQMANQDLGSTDRPPLGDTVISTIVDGILARTSALGTEAKTTAEDVMGDVLRLKRLKSHLEANQLSLGTVSWDSIVSRLLEHSNTTDGLNPRYMTSVLGLAGCYGVEGVARNTVGQDKSSTSPSYVFDVSGGILGLYHQTLQAHIQARDVRGAMDTLTQLQSFTDANKQRSVDEFLETLAETKAPAGEARLILGSRHQQQQVSTERGSGHSFRGIECPTYHPSIPPTLLAGLLNLTTDAEMEEVGQWMVHSEEVDGPLIPRHLYSHPALAGALIRHAAHANDTDLLREVTRVQSNDLAGQTLVALCYSFAVDANWKGTLRVIGLSKQYSLHTWTIMDVALIAKALLGHIQSPLQPKSVTGAEFMLQKLLRGDLFLGLGPQSTDMEALAEIISSIDGNMASLCENVVRREGLSRFNLPLECFNTLLEGIARAYGSLRAQDLYVQWCTPGQHELGKVSAQERIDETGEKHSIAELFSRPASENGCERDGKRTTSEIAPAVFKPTLATIRTVIDQALTESRSSGDDYIADTVDEGLPTVKASFTELETMEWAAEVLRKDFGMGEADVDYELQGYLSAQGSSFGNSKNIEPLYSEQTLTMWRALAGSRLAWAQEAEERMRSFARSRMQQHMQSEPVAAAERYFLHCLAEEFGFSSKSIGEGAERAVAFAKNSTTWQDLKYAVPMTKVGDAADRYFAV